MSVSSFQFQFLEPGPSPVPTLLEPSRGRAGTVPVLVGAPGRGSMWESFLSAAAPEAQGPRDRCASLSLTTPRDRAVLRVLVTRTWSLLGSSLLSPRQGLCPHLRFKVIFPCVRTSVRSSSGPGDFVRLPSLSSAQRGPVLCLRPWSRVRGQPRGLGAVAASEGLCAPSPERVQGSSGLGTPEPPFLVCSRPPRSPEQREPRKCPVGPHMLLTLSGP